MNNKIRIIDTSMRDGMHGVSHKFTPKDIEYISTWAEKAKIDTIEVGHGDGLSGSSINYGFAAASDQDYLRSSKKVLQNTNLAVLLLPGIGTKEDLKLARENEVDIARIATHVTEADVSKQHIGYANKLGFEVMTFLMMAHMADKEVLLEEAKKMESYGAEVVYVVDSAGALTPDEVRLKVSYLKDNMSVPIGFHAHNNLGLGIGNTIAAVEEGATVVDGSLAGLGAGAGNAQTEVLAVVLEKMGYNTGINIKNVMDAAENLRNMNLNRVPVIDKNSLALGYAGVYSSFLIHVEKASKKYNVDSIDILMELGKRKVVGGQEDWIFDVAYELSNIN